MTVTFYMDEQVPRAITVGLRVRGVDVLTAQEDGLRNTPDSVLLDRATALGRVMFSMDAECLLQAMQRQLSSVSFPGLVFTHQRGAHIGDCVHELELVAKTCEPEDLANTVQYLPL